MQEISILIGGKAGDGVKQAGNSVARLMSRLGYFVFFYDDYPSLIRGGHNFSIIRASKVPVRSHSWDVDVVVALNKDTLDMHSHRLRDGGCIIYDSNAVKEGGKGMGVPFMELVKEKGGSPIMRNTAALGALAKALGIEWPRLEELIRDTIPKGIETNLAIARTSYEYLKAPVFSVEPTGSEPLPVVTGNEALALGAAEAGLEMYIAYPMTPASSILHFYAGNSKELGVTAIHPESEISAALMMLGAAYAGRRTMTGTSGGGFALMTEAVSLAAQAEIPAVFVECQRAGPSTGVPTYTMQGDLYFVLHSGHGDIVRIVVAPGDAEEAYEWGALALDAAWAFQCPVFILSDKHLGESAYGFRRPQGIKRLMGPRLSDGAGPYKRYFDPGDGISPLAYPGTQGAVVKVTSYEHDQYGITVEDPEGISFMQEKRLKKASKIREAMEGLDVVKSYGNHKAKTCLVFWGSTKGAAVEACERLGIKGVQPIALDPFFPEKIRNEIGEAERVICAETNATGQLARLLRMNGVEIHETILRYDGRPFTHEDLVKRIREIL